MIFSVRSMDCQEEEEEEERKQALFVCVYFSLCLSHFSPNLPRQLLTNGLGIEFYQDGDLCIG